jgi:chaperonin GroEL
VSGRSGRMLYGDPARAALVRGIDLMAALVAPTLGPTARTVAVGSLVSKTPEVLDSGATIARRTIQLADPFEDMGGMLLRHVLLSVVERTGDGTATTAVLTHALVHALHRYVAQGGNTVEVDRGLDCALHGVLDALRVQARPIEGADAISGVAAAVVGDSHIASVIGEIFDATGPDGAVVVESGEATDTTFEYMQGVRWDGGLVSEVFLDAGQATARLLEPRILLADCVLETPEQVLPVLEACLSEGERRLFIVAQHVREPVVALLAINRQRGVLEGVAAVRAPSTGDTRAAILGDLATITGGRLLQPAGGGLADFTLADLGRARQAWATRQAFGVLGGRGSRSGIRDRVAAARAELGRAGDDQHVRKMTQQRIGRLLGLGAVIRVGAASDLAREELRLRVEAAVGSARLALEEGVVAGGGAALVACAQSLRCWRSTDEEARAATFLADALLAPMRTIVRNAGYVETGSILDEAARRGPRMTFDVLRGEWVDAWQAGLLDPLAVVRTAVDVSVSVARSAMRTEVLVRRRQAPPPPGR